MKWKFVLPIIGIMILAYICANLVYDRYQENLSNSGNVIYILQQGVYTNSESIKNIGASYITVERDDKYYTYLGMTMSSDNAKKVKEIYERQDIPIYIREEVIKSPEFLSELGQYDILLANTDNEVEIANILETILSTYEETIKNE